jgi:hypothetical protein
MSRELIFEWRGESASFGFARIERSQLYGSRKRLAVDASGAACTRASMTLDGTTVLRPGMTAQGWFTDEGEQVESAEVIAVRPDGRPLETHPSTLGVAQPLAGPIDPREVLDLAVEAVLVLSPQSLPSSLKSELDAGRCFRFTYCYRAEPDPPTAFLVANAEGVFAVVGRPTECQWMTREQTAPDSQADEQDDLDFEMV